MGLVQGVGTFGDHGGVKVDLLHRLCQPVELRELRRLLALLLPSFLSRRLLALGRGLQQLLQLAGEGLVPLGGDLDDALRHFLREPRERLELKVLAGVVKFLRGELKLGVPQAVGDVVVQRLPEDLAPQVDLRILLLALEQREPRLQARELLAVEHAAGRGHGLQALLEVVELHGRRLLPGARGLACEQRKRSRSARPCARRP
mmetsp:Transcript_5566/g.17122  ORF Transcript_5566/g.17122 Transcript_5566/m.17122 type:complete len:203 (-) Transcript_5566:2-610(-)